MSGRDVSTSMGGASDRFPDTLWESVLGAGKGLQREDYLDHLCTSYWRPVYTYVRSRWGKTNEEAKDLTQAFFTQIIERDILHGVDPELGRFRTYLLACLRNFLLDDGRIRGAVKRGGRARTLSLDGAELPVVAPGGNPETEFEAAWNRELVDRALTRLDELMTRAGKAEGYQMFRLVHPMGDEEPRTHGELADRFHTSKQAVRYQIDYARRLFRQQLLSQIREYCSSSEEARDELSTLFPD